MLKSIFDAIMERRARRLMELVRDWLPLQGTVLDLGSGTGHLATRVENTLRLQVVAADVSDLHVVGRSPLLIEDGDLPFEEETFSAALLVFMLAYPRDPVAVLKDVARVTHGPIIVVQSLYGGRVGHAWLRAREFLWTVVAFHVSKIFSYIPAEAEYRMLARRFYTDQEIRRDMISAGLRIRERRDRPVLPCRALVVAALIVDRND